jgi:hypothetical protein
MPVLRLLLILAIAATCTVVTWLCWIKLQNEPFALYAGFLTLTVFMWILKLPRPSWMEAKELEKMLEKLSGRHVGRQIAKTVPMGDLKDHSPLAVMIRAAAYLEDSYRICGDIADIGKEKFIIYLGVGVIALFVNVKGEESQEVLLLKIVSSVLLFGIPFLLSFGVFSKQKQFNEELLTRARVNGYDK